MFSNIVNFDPAIGRLEIKRCFCFAVRRGINYRSNLKETLQIVWKEPLIDVGVSFQKFPLV